MKKFLPLALSLALAATLFSACASQKSLYPLDGKWMVESIGTTPVKASAETTPYLLFRLNEQQLNGYSGCNNLASALDMNALKKGKLAFPRMAATLRLCPDAAHEQAFLAALDKVRSYKLDGATLRLCDEAGKPLVSLKKQAAE